MQEIAHQENFVQMATPLQIVMLRQIAPTDSGRPGVQVSATLIPLQTAMGMWAKARLQMNALHALPATSL